MPRTSGNAVMRVKDATPGPWAKWRGTRASKAIRFIQKYYRPYRGVGSGELMRLLPWEKERIEEFLEDGVTAGALVMGRGGGKSTLWGALAAWGGFTDDDSGAPSVPIVAASLGQAKDAVYTGLVAAVQAEPELADRSLVFSGIGTERILIPRTGGRIFPRSADPNTLQGMDIYPIGLVDEIGHIELETWNAVLMGRKRHGAVVLGAGTPGPDLDTPIYQIRRLVRGGGAPSSFRYAEYSGVPGADIHDEDNWRGANPSLEHGFPAIEFLRNAADMSPEPLFRTYHLAEFDVVGHDSWLGPDARNIWAALTDPYPLVDHADTYVGIDVGLVRDNTAVVSVQLRPDGRLHARSQVWMPAPGESVDITAVTGYIRELATRYAVKAISYDPRLFELPAMMLLESRLPMVEVPQSIERMTPIVGALYELIRRGGLSHDDDQVFSDQVVNAVPRLNERGYTLSKSKSAPRGHIDAAVALALAVDRAQHPVKKRAPLVIL